MDVEFSYSSTSEEVRLGQKHVERFAAGATRDRWILSPMPSRWVMTSWGSAS